MQQFTLCAFADEASPNLDGQLTALQRNGITHLEIRGVDGKNVTALTETEAKQVKSRLDAAGINVWSVGSPIGKIRLDEDFTAHLELLKHTLELGNILGAHVLRMFSFYPAEGKTQTDGKNQVMDQLGQMLEVAKDSGITLCHENEKGIYGDIACRCAEIHASFPELPAVFDPANFIQSGQDPLAAWQLLDKYVRYFHIKDALADGNVVPAGCGIGNLPVLVKNYAGLGGKVLTVEPHLQVFDGLAGLEREGEQSGIGKAYSYPTADAAFDAAADALKKILADME